MNIRDFRNAVIAAQQNISPTETTWTGLGSTDNWSVPTNWNGNRIPASNNSLIFGGVTRLTPTNDIASFSVNNITFPAAAGAFSISGFEFTKLDNSFITNNSSNTQTISNGIGLSPGTAGCAINCNTAAIVLSGIISGANRIIKNGTDALTLSGNNAYTGGTYINAGTIKLGNTAALGAADSTCAIAANAVLDINGVTQSRQISFIGAGIITNTIFGFQRTFQCGHSSVNAIFTGNIVQPQNTGSIAITKIGANTQTFSGTNNSTGQVRINGGTLELAQLNNGTSREIVFGSFSGPATFRYIGASAMDAPIRRINIGGAETVSTVDSAGVGTLSIGGAEIIISTAGPKTLRLQGNNSGNNNIGHSTSHIIDGLNVLSILKEGTGKWILGSQSNAYSGSTSITAGTLVAAKGIATSSFTALPLITDFSSTPAIGQTYRLFPGSTVQRYYSPNRSNGVLFTDSGDLVTLASHGLPNGTAVYFSSITTTTGISINTRYYVISSLADTFQLSETIGGVALPLAANGRGIMSLSTSIGSVAFVDSTNRVTLGAHGLTNDTAIYFSSITTTTGISANTVYYVISATTGDFQLAATVGGSIIDLVTDGTGVLCKNPIVSLTNASGNIGSYSSNSSTLSVIGQLGTDIVGSQFAQAGLAVDINAAGDVIAFGCPALAGVSSKVFVYAWDGTAWVQRGATFSGSSGEYLGYDVSLNADGTVVAMSTGLGDSVKVYAWIGSTWTQRGATFVAASGEGSLGYSISLNATGDKIAIGAPFAQVGTGQPIGLVKVYSWDGSTWIQLGSTFVGSAVTPTNTRVGTKVVLNNTGDRMLITSNGDATAKGLTRIYSYSGSSWSQLGNDIIGSANNEQLGIPSASMNAVGDIVALSSTSANKVKVYSLIASTWTQLGSDIIEVNNNYFGRSVSLNDAGNRIAIGEIYFSDAISSRGRTRIYDFSSSVWSQFGADILGNSASSFSGSDVALNSSGDRIIVGSPENSAFGYVQAFQI